VIAAALEPRPGPWSPPERGDGGALRDRGLKIALDPPAADQDVAVVLHAIRTAAATGEVFSINTIKDVIRAVAPAVIGAAFQVSYRRREIEPVGYERADHRTGHRKTVRTWRGANLPPHERGGAAVPAAAGAADTGNANDADQSQG